MKKVIAVLIGLILLGGAGWLIYQRITSAEEDAPRRRRGGGAVAVESAPVRTETIRDVGRFTGSLQPASRFIVSPKISGRLRKLMVDIGDRVARNAPIALLENDEYAQQVKEAEAELAVAEAQVQEAESDRNVAQQELARVDALQKKRIASEAELDEAKAKQQASEAKFKVAEARVLQRQAALRGATIRLGYASIAASWEAPEEATGAGEADSRPASEPAAASAPSADEPKRAIGERFVDEGALLKANDPIVSIIQDDPLTAVVYAIERDYPRMRVGRTVTLSTDAYPGRTFPGTIQRVAPVLQEASRQARVEIAVSNGGLLLRPGMYVRAEIEFARSEGATVVPAAALVKREGKEGVFLVERTPAAEGARPATVARFVPVTVGIASGEVVEIRSPRLRGEVITLGNHLLEDGTPITLPQPADGGPRGGPASSSTGTGAPVHQRSEGGSR